MPVIPFTAGAPILLPWYDQVHGRNSMTVWRCATKRASRIASRRLLDTLFQMPRRQPGRAKGNLRLRDDQMVR